MPQRLNLWQPQGLGFLPCHTSPQPLADVTLRTVMFMLPPPVPLCVDNEPDSTAVSEFVKGAWGKIITTLNLTRKHYLGPDALCTESIRGRWFNTHFYGLRNVHLVDFNMRKPAAWHLLKILIVAVKQVCGIYTNADGALDMEEIKGRDEQK